MARVSSGERLEGRELLPVWLIAMAGLWQVHSGAGPSSEENPGKDTTMASARQCGLSIPDLTGNEVLITGASSVMDAALAVARAAKGSRVRVHSVPHAAEVGRLQHRADHRGER